MAKKHVLTEKMILKYAKVKNIDKGVMLQLFHDDALSVATVKASLIEHDYDTLMATTELTKTQAKMAVAKEYEVTKSRVETVLYEKKPPVTRFFCSGCGKEMSRYKHTKSNGVCDECVIEQANVSL